MTGAPTALAAGRRADAVGLALVLALAAWVGLVAGAGRGRPGPVLWLLGGLVLAVGVGRRAARVPGLAARCIAASVLGSFALTYPGILSAGGAPTGYANSNATLAAIGVIASLTAARATRGPTTRRAWDGIAAVLAGATVLTLSVAGVLSLATALGLLLLAASIRWAPAMLVGGLVATSLALGVTTALALHDGPPLAGSDIVRVELWAAAADLATEEPARGLGAGAFEDRNPVSRDEDLRWVHHEYLELAVELGGVGLGLVLALVAWTSHRLRVASRHDPARAVLAGAAVTVVTLHAAVDHVWHAPVVLVLVAILFGDATAHGTAPSRPPATLGGRTGKILGRSVHCP